MSLDPTITAAESAALALMSESLPRSPEEQRALALRIDRDVVLPLVADPPAVAVARVTVPVPGRPDVSCHVFTPADATDATDVPACLFFFGGAFRQGGLHFPSLDALLRTRAAASGAVIIAPNYALAPEEPYPSALEQGLAVLRWLFDRTGELGIDPAAVSVGGMSAGGNLAAALALVNRDADGLPLRRQILEVPVTDLTGRHLSTEVAPLIGLEESAMVPMMEEMARNYLAGADPCTATASPLRAPDLSGLPPAHVLVAELDVFRGDGEAYAAALRAQGTPSELHLFADMTHGSLAFTRAVPAAQEWQRTVVDLLRR